MRSVLLTGGSGLVGSHFVDLFRDQHRIISISRSNPHPEHPHYQWIPHDFLRSGLPESIPPVDAVVHLAQHEEYRDFNKRGVEIFRVNVESTLLLLDWARRHSVRHFILASSGGLYGFGERPFTETDELRFEGDLEFYFATKRSAELLAQSYRASFRVIILRFFFVYGTHPNSEKLFPRLVQSVASGRSIRLEGSDGMRFNPVSVSDAATAIESCLNLQDNHVINVAGPDTVSLRHAAELIGRALGQEPRFDIQPLTRSRDLVADTTKMRGILRAPVVPFEEGIRNFCLSTSPTPPKSSP